MSGPSHDITTRKPNRLRRWTLRLLVILIVLLVGAELFCRYSLGLGDPPLLQTDPQIEYLYQPSRIYHRFGNTIAINRWSMRSDDFPATKSDPRELRVLVIGDSVVNGGTQTDQPDIATEIMRADLADRLKRPVVVGNISAGSWGPANMLAYVRKYGFFDADVVIVVLSSHDWDDVPTFAPMGADLPTHRPVLALQEAIGRYLPRYLPPALGGTRGEVTRQPAESAADDPTVAQSLAAMSELARLALESGARVAVAEHLERDESMDHLKPGHDAIIAALRGSNVDIIQLGPSFEQARQAGELPYRDHIHPNEVGQCVIAKVLADWVVAMTRESSTASTRSSSP